MQKQSILFVYINYSSFVKADYDIFSKHANVTKYQFKPVKGLIRTGIELLRELLFLIFNIRKFDTVFIWFGDYHSLFPVLFAKWFRKKSYVVIGGYDVSTLSEYNYGSFNKPIRSFFTRNTFKYVDLCFPVADALREKLLMVSPNAKSETLATSVDPDKFSFSDYQRPQKIITVSGTENHQRIMVKGLDRFRELALLLPEYEFIIIGAIENVRPYFEPIPKNLILLPPQKFDQMTQHYQSASFYAQLSRSEGLPNALCEAMMCGCIPIGTNVGDIKVAIGDTGITIDDWTPEIMVNFVQNNHNNDTLRNKARERIITLYDPAKRTTRLRQLVETTS